MAVLISDNRGCSIYEYLYLAGSQEASIFRKLTVEQNIRAIIESRRDITRKEKKNGWSPSWMNPLRE
jgi:ABC-type lipopolysaccharide export system ATPase subunit